MGAILTALFRLGMTGIIGFIILIFLGIALIIRFTKVNPKITNMHFKEDGTYMKRIFKSTGIGETGWKLDSNHPRKIKFKFYPEGIAKPIEDEWDDDDYIEFKSDDGNRVLVITGVKNFNYKVGNIMHFAQQKINRLGLENTFNKQEYSKIKNNMENEIERRMQQSKAMLIFPTDKKKKK